MPSNDQILNNYIFALSPQPKFFNGPSDGIPVQHSNRTCAICGSKYHLSIAYEHCNPAMRDLCDDCILAQKKPPLTHSLTHLDMTGSDPDLIRAEKTGGS